MKRNVIIKDKEPNEIESPSRKAKSHSAFKLTEEIPSVEFYWVNRKPTSYGWMGKVLMDVQARDPDRNILKTYMFFTSP